MLSREERSSLIHRLETSQEQVVRVTAGLNPAQWAFRPHPESWTAAEVVEHLCDAEALFLQRIENQIRTTAPTPGRRAETERKDRLLLKAVPNRTTRVKAPDSMTPRRRFADGPAALSAFFEARQLTRSFVSATEAPLRDYLHPHFILGMLDSYQWLLLAALHADRHAAQIEEMKQQAGFPGSAI